MMASFPAITEVVVAPLLILSCGNPSRGDDALGYEIHEWICKQQRIDTAWAAVESITDFQLQVEHALDLQGRKQLLFVDASMSIESDCVMSTLSASKDQSYTSHAMSPGSVLQAYETVFGEPPPSAHVLAIRGGSYELGNPLSQQARKNLEQAKRLVEGWVIRFSE